MTCPDCQGTGKIVLLTSVEPCMKCAGTGVDVDSLDPMDNPFLTDVYKASLAGLAISDECREGIACDPPPFRIAVLDLKPGDRLVLKFDGIISEEGIIRIRAHVRQILPNIDVLVIDGRIDLSILRQSE